jgi:hypothetical protein
VTRHGTYSARQSGVEKGYMNTTIPVDMIRSLKILAANKEVRLNDVLTEAIQDLLKKYAARAK